MADAMWRSLASMAVAMLRSQAKSLARTIRALTEMAALPVVVVVVVATSVEGSSLLPLCVPGPRFCQTFSLAAQRAQQR